MGWPGMAGFGRLGSTFLIFSDYMRRLCVWPDSQGAPVIYVYTHDSIGLGEDGPTHQPVEQLMALRVVPNLTTIRPADARETVGAWLAAIPEDRWPDSTGLFTAICADA
ncbi:MAG: hypothetical protein R3C44_23685 [Chloroflexota bacterium]